MSHYQFFRNEENKGLTYLEANTATYNEEKEQLLAQGFSVDNNHYIEAKNAEAALEKCNDIKVEALDSYGSIIISIQGMFELAKKLIKR